MYYNYVEKPTNKKKKMPGLVRSVRAQESVRYSLLTRLLLNGRFRRSPIVKHEIRRVQKRRKCLTIETTGRPVRAVNVNCNGTARFRTLSLTLHR